MKLHTDTQTHDLDYYFPLPLVLSTAPDAGLPHLAAGASAGGGGPGDSQATIRRAGQV